MLKLFKFAGQVRQEVQKVVWPEKKELITSVSVVVVAVLVVGFITMILDYGIHSSVNFLLNIGK